MRVINLSSGSEGNITFLECDGVKVLIDAGLSCMQICKRLKVLDVNPSELDAVFLTHEHIDHVKGADILSGQYNIPVFAHEKVWMSYDGKAKRISSLNRKAFSDNFNFKNLEVQPIEIPHDVVCFGYSFLNNGKKISILTDLGHTNDRILTSVSNSQLIYLEANYDRAMLMSGTKYPLSLKMRIDGPNGHLSNDASAQAADFLVRTGTRQIILSHLSKENNRPELAYNHVCRKLLQNGIEEGRDVKIDVATTEIGAMFRLK